jgi:hypothetical protein
LSVLQVPSSMVMCAMEVWHARTSCGRTMASSSPPTSGGGRLPLYAPTVEGSDSIHTGTDLAFPAT